ncbi:response regulator transcription factor [Streptomyces sp. NPDC006602]|uniref:response regulator transcription factor n=1 Tax=Streptomyces sp. NPDC006602 TaxID=3364751 RepID=UPI0036AE292E
MLSDLNLDDTDISILGLMRMGLSDAAIARRLQVGHRTIQRRVQQLMAKLSVPNRFALGARAQQLGLLGPFVPDSNRPTLLEKTL